MELSEVFLRCGDPQDSRFGHCQAYDAWRKSDLASAKNSEKDLIPLLADPRVSVRRLVATAIAAHSCSQADACAWANDAALSLRVLDRAEAEQDGITLFHLASGVAKIDVAATGLRERVEKFVMNAPKDPAHAFLNTWLQRNPGQFATVAALTTATEPHLRSGAIGGLRYALGGEHHVQACALLLDAFAKLGNDSAVRSIVEGFQSRPPCLDSWDALLGNAESRVKELSRENSSFLEAVWTLYGRQEATAKQKARVLAVARQVAAAAWNPAGVRISALSFVARKDPEPLAYLRRFEQDSQPEVRRAADRLKSEISGRAAVQDEEGDGTRPRRPPAAKRPPSPPISKPVAAAPAAPAPARVAVPAVKPRLAPSVAAIRPAVNDPSTELLVPEGETWSGTVDILEGARWSARSTRHRLSPDARVWVASDDDKHRVFDAETGAQLYELERTGFSGFGFGFSPDGSVLATRKATGAGDQQVLRFIDPKKGTELAALDTGKDYQYAFAFTTQEKLAALVAGANIVVFDLATLSERKRIAIPPSGADSSVVKHLAVSARGESFVVATDASVRRLDAAGNQVWSVKVAEAGARQISGLGYEEQSGTVQVVLPDGSLAVLDAADGREVRKVEDKGIGGFHGLSLTADGRLLGTLAGSSVRLYVPHSGRNAFGMVGDGVDLDIPGGILIHRGSKSFLFHPQSAAGNVRESPPISPPVEALAASDDGTLVAAAVSGGPVRVFDARDGRLLRTLEVPERVSRASLVGVLAFKPRGHTLVLGGYKLVQWDLDTEAPARVSDSSWTSWLAHNASGSKIVIGETCAAWVHDAATGGLERQLPGGEELRDCARAGLSPDGSELATPFGDTMMSTKPTKILVRRTEDGRPIRTIETKQERVRTVAYSPDGSRLVAAGARGLSVFQTATGATLREIELGEQFHDVSWSADGRSIAALSALGVVKTLDSQTGALLASHVASGRLLAMAGGVPVTAGSGLTIWSDPPVRIRFDSAGNWVSLQGDRMLRHDTGTLLLARGAREGAFDRLAPSRATAEPRLTLRQASAKADSASTGYVPVIMAEVANEGSGRAYWVTIAGSSKPPGAIVQADRVQRLEPGARAQFEVRVAPPQRKPGEALELTLEVVHAHGKGTTREVRLPPDPAGALAFDNARVNDKPEIPTVAVELANTGTGALEALALTARFLRDGALVERKELSVSLAAGERRELALALPEPLREEGTAFSVDLFANPGIRPAAVWAKRYTLETPSHRSMRMMGIAGAGTVLLVIGLALRRRRARSRG